MADVKEKAGRAAGPSLQANAQAKMLVAGTSEEDWPGIKRGMEEVNAASQKMSNEGLSQVAFFVGVLNVSVTSFVLGRFPEYIWVLYVLKVLTYIPVWFVEVVRRFNGALFVLDYCWVMNISLGLYMLANLVYGTSIPAWVQKGAFQWFFATALGPLSWAALALQNGLIFHSIERTASLFIHFTPCVVCWTLRWSPELMIRTWPGHFTEEVLEMASAGEIYKAGMTGYLIWLCLHGLWLLTVGVDAPSKGWSTVFECLNEKNKLQQKFGTKTIRQTAAVYLAIHAVCCTICFSWAMLCYKFWMVHTAWCCVIFLSTVWIGSGYYMFVFQSVYLKALKKLMPADADLENPPL